MNDNYNKKILFLGNSYIFTNDLPCILSNLAQSAGYSIFVEQVSRGGAILENFLNKDDELCIAMNIKLKEQSWDYVVLQEQSQIPAVLSQRYQKMYPAVRILNKMIENNGAKTVLYMTWGRRDGDDETGFKNFESMQEALIEGYINIANEISSLIVPAGIAWLRAKQKEKDVDLWGEDGSHPSIIGTYLTACTFYSSLFKRSPLGLSYASGISKEREEFLQQIASEAVNTF